MDHLKHNGVDYSPSMENVLFSFHRYNFVYIFSVWFFCAPADCRPRFVLLISVIYRCVFLLKINYRKTSRVKNFMFARISLGNAKRIRFRFRHFVSISLDKLNGKVYISRYFSKISYLYTLKMYMKVVSFAYF